MCIFCNNETKREEAEKYYIEQCDNCNGKVLISKKNGRINVSKFPKHDILIARLFFLLLLLLLIIPFSLLILTDISSKHFMYIFGIGLIISATYFVYYSIKNILTYKKRGYMYSGITVITKDEKSSKLLLSKIVNYIILFVTIQSIIVWIMYLMLIDHGIINLFD